MDKYTHEAGLADAKLIEAEKLLEGAGADWNRSTVGQSVGFLREARRDLMQVQATLQGCNSWADGPRRELDNALGVLMEEIRRQVDHWAQPLIDDRAGGEWVDLGGMQAQLLYRGKFDEGHVAYLRVDAYDRSSARVVAEGYGRITESDYDEGGYWTFSVVVTDPEVLEHVKQKGAAR